MHRLFKLVFLALVGVFTMVILIVSIAVFALLALLSLLRGRKPAIFTSYSRAREFSQRFRGEAFRPPQPNHAANDDIVDVQAHEVRYNLTAPERPVDPLQK